MLRALHAVPVENSVQEGTPDINTVYGWLELKQLPAWPVRPDTPVGNGLLRPGQGPWLARRCAHGGAAWVLLRIGREWILLWGAWAAQHLGRTNRKQLVQAAVAYWPTGVVQQQLVEHLTRCSPRS